jgi:hypothetical protein
MVKNSAWGDDAVVNKKLKQVVECTIPRISTKKQKKAIRRLIINIMT